jgi:phosphatidylethanolamine/phosphatidyl-N-methylethanolamine N-methyltransferase
MLIYLKNVIKDKHIASIMPTSASGVKKVCSKIDFTKDNFYVEYGPATGIFTRYILKNMTRGSQIALIERNKNFVSVLENTFTDDRVNIYHDSAEKAADIVLRISEAGADYVLSGIPFSFFDERMRSNIVRQTHRILHKGGKFLPYQTFFQQNQHLFDHMRDVFATVEDEYYLWNVPPMRIYEAVK